MALWQKIQMLDTVYLEQVHNLYMDERLPMEVREYIAYWIEEQDWNQAAQFGSSLACCLFHNMQSLLDDQLGRLVLSEENNSNIVLKHNLHRSKVHLQALYQDHPEQLAQVIDDLLKQEREILAAALAASQPVVEAPVTASMTSSQQEKIGARLSEMRKAIQALKNSIDQLELLQDTFDFRFKTQRILESTVPNTDPGLIRRMQELQIMLNKVDRSRKEVLAQIQGLLGFFETLRDLLLEEREAWKDRQRQACIGNNCDTRLGQLEKWFTANAEDLFHLLQLLQTLKDLQQKLTYDQDQLKMCLPQLENRLKEQIIFLLKSAFVVEIQPTMPYPCRRPLVLRTNQKFSVRARLLVKLMDRNHPMEAKIEIDRDSTNLAGFRKFNILTSTTKTLMMDRPQTEGLICDFKHISLREQKISGSGKGKGGKGISEGGLSVLEELHVITFTLDYWYQGLQCQLQTSTLPMIIISNVSQMSSAWASILWFIMLNRDPLNQRFFINPPAATWPQLSTVLSWQFSSATEKGLNADQLKMLGEKLCGSPVTAQSIITWSQFAKDSPPSFSFWTWIDGILLLIQENLLHLWKNDLIMGFVSRKRERHLLKKKRGGTFLLRFSESTKSGGITCTWVEYDDKGSPMFSAVEPYTREQLKVLPLPDIIRDYHVLADEVIPENPLQYLYPDTPRDEAFGPYYSERREADLPEQRKYLTRRLISVSSSITNPSRQPEEVQALDFLVADSNASDFQDLELKAPDHHIPEASVPMVNGVVFENGIALPSELEEPEQGGLLCNSQDPYLLQLEDEQYLGQVTSELFMPSEELQELKLDDEDLNF
ncbi:signal transducer and activator of transcription 2 isoform X1 [Anolis carolinensis]|uniref:Signal transducer and activator of transcription n=1 Tax=Anolis carolinensis TaxID=28377 RepID=G1KV19_ANOCA|nr:PREDICTED: signal transducer and activator of transcription 2 isoform X1 [Anolis carolinensis]|eukprot:XP_008102199.1 PREDICTED: signal transducer and activator of transcription 2 isoform X1 [Anolis carolinensis]